MSNTSKKKKNYSLSDNEKIILKYCKKKLKKPSQYFNKKLFKKSNNYFDKSIIMSKYRYQEKVLDDLFLRYKSNKKQEYVLVKVDILDEFYSTMLYKKGKKQVVKKIITSFDTLLKSVNNEFDFKLFNSMTRVNGKRCVSFLSKYLSRYSKAKIPIYDSYVRVLLSWYFAIIESEENKSNNNKSTISEKEKLFKKQYSNMYNNYKNYSNNIKIFKEKINNKLKIKLDYKALDKFLWGFAKGIISGDIK